MKLSQRQPLNSHSRATMQAHKKDTQADVEERNRAFYRATAKADAATAHLMRGLLSKQKP